MNRPSSSGWFRAMDTRHGVVAITFLAFFMQVVVEATSWWYVFTVYTLSKTNTAVRVCVCCAL